MKMTRPHSIREPNFIIVCVNPFFVVSLVGLHVAYTLVFVAVYVWMQVCRQVWACVFHSVAN